MQTVTLTEAQQHLLELVRDLAREGELLITDADKPVAKLSPVTLEMGRSSLRALKPSSVGAVLRPFPSTDDDPWAKCSTRGNDRRGHHLPGATRTHRVASARTPAPRDSPATIPSALAPQVLAEFIHVVTDPGRFQKPLTADEAVAKARFWWNAAEVQRVFPTSESTTLFLDWMQRHQLGRKRIIDTQFAVTLWTARCKANNGVPPAATSNPATLSVNPPPLNHDYINAIALAGSDVHVTWSNLSATFQIGEPLHVGISGGHSVWWKWQSPGNGQVSINTIGSSF